MNEFTEGFFTSVLAVCTFGILFLELLGDKIERWLEKHQKGRKEDE